jgi:hypothetical protein
MEMNACCDFKEWVYKMGKRMTGQENEREKRTEIIC